MPNENTQDAGDDAAQMKPDVAVADDRTPPADRPGDIATTDITRLDATQSDTAQADTVQTDTAMSADAATDAATPTDTMVTIDRATPADVGAVMDAGTDVVALMDVARDVATDVARDTGVDVLADAGADVPRDVAMDVPRDVAMDVPRDVAMDVAIDLPRDVLVDVPRDTGVDVPRDTGVDIPRDRGTFPTVEDDPVAYTGSFPARTGRFSTSLTIMGVRRTVDMYVPLSGGAGLPLVLMFHGTNGSGSQIMTDESAQSVANANGFVVAAPTSRYIDHGDWDHATAETYWETYPNTNPDANVDVLLARAIMVEAQRAYGTDPERVYALGHSSGGFFTIFLMTLLQDRFAAFVENSAGLVACATTSTCRFRGAGSTCDILSGRSGWCNCTGTTKPNALPTTGRQPAGYLVHGNNDTLVSVYYSCSLLSQMNDLGWEAEFHMREGDGHDIPATLLRDAWPFLSSHVRQ